MGVLMYLYDHSPDNIKSTYIGLMRKFFGDKYVPWAGRWSNMITDVMLLSLNDPPPVCSTEPQLLCPLRSPSHSSLLLLHAPA
jgi:hypothetical protein